MRTAITTLMVLLELALLITLPAFLMPGDSVRTARAYRHWMATPSAETKDALEDVKRLDRRDDNIVRVVFLSIFAANTYCLVCRFWKKQKKDGQPAH